jgi:hypothetical protein
MDTRGALRGTRGCYGGLKRHSRGSGGFQAVVGCTLGVLRGYPQTETQTHAPTQCQLARGIETHVYGDTIVCIRISCITLGKTLCVYVCVHSSVCVHVCACVSVCMCACVCVCERVVTGACATAVRAPSWLRRYS